MAKREPLQMIRLADVPIEKRLAAARREAHTTADPAEREALIVAALFPSDKVYFVRADAEVDGDVRAAA